MAPPNSSLSQRSRPSWNSPKTDPARIVRVGVIGSGLAGLLTAYSLATTTKNLRFKSSELATLKLPILDVHLFESSPKLGLSHASTQVSLTADNKICQADEPLEECASGIGRRHWNIDSPMRAIQSGYYKHVGQLYRFLKIPLTKTDFSYSFYGTHPTPARHSALRRSNLLYSGTNQYFLGRINKPSHITTWVSLDGIWNLSYSLYICLTYGLLLATSALSYYARKKPLRAQSTSFFSFVFACGLHNLGTKVGLGSEDSKYLSVRDWEHSPLVPFWPKWCLNRKLKRELLDPLFCSICSCSINELDSYLMSDVFDFIWLTFGRSYYACSQGVNAVAKLLTQPLESKNIHLGADGTITQIFPISVDRPQIQIHTRSGRQHAFDHLIFATQADQLRTLLESMCETNPPENIVAERERIELLSRFTYCKTLVINHMDPSVLPDDPRDWRDLNFTTSFPRKRDHSVQPQTLFRTEQAAGLRWSSELMSGDVRRTSQRAVLQPETSALSSSIRSLAQCSSSHEVIKSQDPIYHSVFDEAAYWMSTYIIHRPRSVQDGHILLQTTNPITPIKQSLIINQAWFNRVLVNAESRRAFHRLKDGPALGLHQIWFTGSWFSEGIPLLEGCVSSSEFIVKRLVEHLAQNPPDEKLELQFAWED